MFQFDRRTLYIILAVLAIMGIASYIATPTKLLSLILTLPAVLIAITFHEFAHAFAADKLGDDTPRREGRLSLNPFAHLDPWGTLLLVFAGFGWGKPVRINPRNFDRKVSMSAGEAIVSIAGPLMNFILAIVFSIICCLLVKFAPSFVLNTTLGMVISTLIYQIIAINIGLGVFNLIPLPPLDGSKVLRHFLPYSAKDWMDRNGRLFYIIFIVIWITGIASLIISPIISVITNGIVGLTANMFGLHYINGYFLL